MHRTRLCLPVLLLGLAVGSASADPIVIEIKGQGFVPQTISVPAGLKMELQVRNDDALPAEFESYDLSREIVVPAHGQVKVFIGPLEPGRYRFFNDFHQESEGWVVVAAAPK